MFQLFVICTGTKTGRIIQPTWVCQGRAPSLSSWSECTPEAPPPATTSTTPSAGRSMTLHHYKHCAQSHTKMTDTCYYNRLQTTCSFQLPVAKCKVTKRSPFCFTQVHVSMIWTIKEAEHKLPCGETTPLSENLPFMFLCQWTRQDHPSTSVNKAGPSLRVNVSEQGRTIPPCQCQWTRQDHPSMSVNKAGPSLHVSEQGRTIPPCQWTRQDHLSVSMSVNKAGPSLHVSEQGRTIPLCQWTRQDHPSVSVNKAGPSLRVSEQGRTIPPCQWTRQDHPSMSVNKAGPSFFRPFFWNPSSVFPHKWTNINAMLLKRKTK